MSDSEQELVEILQKHCGERGEAETVKEALERIINERDYAIHSIGFCPSKELMEYQKRLRDAEKKGISRRVLDRQILMEKGYDRGERL